MIAQQYKDVSDSISSVVKALVPQRDSYHTIHAHRNARTLQVLLEQNPKGTLLELGTSQIIPLALQTLAPKLKVHVSDFDLDKPAKGSMTLSMGESSRKVTVYRVDLETQALPVDDETFDHVICGEVIEHLELDPMFMMSEINRVLKPGGTLILTTPNITSRSAIWKILRGMDPYFYMQYRHSPKLYRHNYEYSPNSMAQILKASGFSGSLWTEDSWEDGPTEDMEKLRSVGYTLENTGDNIFCLAKKVGPVVDRHPKVIYVD